MIRFFRTGNSLDVVIYESTLIMGLSDELIARFIERHLEPYFRFVYGEDVEVEIYNKDDEFDLDALCEEAIARCEENYNEPHKVIILNEFVTQFIDIEDEQEETNTGVKISFLIDHERETGITLIFTAATREDFLMCWPIHQIPVNVTVGKAGEDYMQNAFQLQRYAHRLSPNDPVAAVETEDSNGDIKFVVLRLTPQDF